LRSGAATSPLEGDLVMDTSGRTSRAPQWLEQLGYRPPTERELRSLIGDATVPARLPEGLLPEGVAGVLAPPHPGNLRGAAIMPCDNGLHQLAGLGMMRANPPSERGGFLAHLDGAPSPLVGRIAREMEILEEVATYRLAGTRRKLWETLDRRPEGFVVVGDAVMSVDPIYGQGMAVAAVSAVALPQLLGDAAGDVTGLASRVQKGLEQVTDNVFSMVTAADAFYPGVELHGVDPPSPEATAYSRAVAQVATEDAETSLALKYAAHYFDTDLVRAPAIRAKVEAWVSAGRTVVHDDPNVIPELLG